MQDKIIADIRGGKRDALVKLYKQYRVDFIKWALKSFHCTQQEAEDAYQDTTIAFYENVMKGKVNHFETLLLRSFIDKKDCRAVGL